MNEEERLAPKLVKREELGGDFYYRCPWIVCDKILKRDWDFCPYCGQKLVYED